MSFRKLKEKGKYNKQLKAIYKYIYKYTIDNFHLPPLSQHV